MNRTTRALAALFTTLALALAPLALVAPAQAADTPKCVSKPEFRKVSRGMSLGKVHRIFD